MTQAYFYLLIGLVYSLSLFIGWWHKTDDRSGTQYLLGGKQFATWQLTLTILAAQLGGGSLLGTCDTARTHGWGGIAYGAGMALGLLLIGFFFAEKLQRLPSGTISQALGTLYHSRSLQQIAAVLSIATLFCSLIATAVAMRKLFHFVGAPDVVFLVFWAVFITYTVLGGLHAVILTDIVQAICILGILLLFTGYMYFHSDLALPTHGMQFLHQPADAEAISWVDWILMPALFVIIGQDMGQRCFAATSPKSIQTAMKAAAVLILLCVLVPVSVGVLTRNLGLSISPSTSTLLTSVQQLTTPWLTMLVTAAVLMAIISTADSLLCALSSNLGFDFHLHKNVRWLQALTTLAGILAACASFFLQDIISTLLLGYELSVCILLVPFLSAMLFRSTCLPAAFSAMGVGATLFASTQWTPWITCWEILLANIVSYAGVARWTKRQLL